MLACTWVSSKFEHRAPAGHVLLRCFVQDLAKSDDELTSESHGELRAIAGVRGEPVLRVVSRWPRSMPQYTTGHERRVAEIFRVANEAGIYLAGNAYEGVGVPDTIRRTRATARELITSLRSGPR